MFGGSPVRRHAVAGLVSVLASLACALPADPGKDTIDIARASDLEREKSHAQPWRRRLDVLELTRRLRGSRVPEDRDTRYRRDGCLEQLHPLRAQIGVPIRISGDVAPGTSKADDEPRSNRIGIDGNHDGQVALRIPRRENRGRPVRYDNVHLKPHEVGGKPGKLVQLLRRVPLFYDDVLALPVSQFAKAVPKG